MENFIKNKMQGFNDILLASVFIESFMTSLIICSFLILVKLYVRKCLCHFTKSTFHYFTRLSCDKTFIFIINLLKFYINILSKKDVA